MFVDIYFSDIIELFIILYLNTELGRKIGTKVCCLIMMRGSFLHNFSSVFATNDV